MIRFLIMLFRSYLWHTRICSNKMKQVIVWYKFHRFPIASRSWNSTGCFGIRLFRVNKHQTCIIRSAHPRNCISQLHNRISFTFGVATRVACQLEYRYTFQNSLNDPYYKIQSGLYAVHIGSCHNYRDKAPVAACSDNIKHKYHYYPSTAEVLNR